MSTPSSSRPPAAIAAALVVALAGGIAIARAEPELRHAISTDREGAAFVPCSGLVRVTCVVDGDTFWYRGTKIRIADINAPELSRPACAREERLAAAAARRLTVLLNAGPFSLATQGRETDRYGRALRVVLRRGESLGTVLEREGLAEHWRGRRSDWCAV